MHCRRGALGNVENFRVTLAPGPEFKTFPGDAAKLARVFWQSELRSSE